jgi:hypothetical protein
LHIVNTLFSYEPKHLRTNLVVAFDHLARVKGQQGVIFFLSDFMGELSGAMMKVVAQRHEVMAFRCLDPKERTFPPVGTLIFEDRETNDKLAVAGGQGAALDTALKDWNDRQREKLVGARIDTLDIEVGTQFTGDLLKFLRQRMLGRR